MTTNIDMSLQPPFHRILDTPVDRLAELPESFKIRTRLLGFSTLRDIALSDKGELQRHPHFDFGWYLELLDVMEKHGFISMMNG